MGWVKTVLIREKATKPSTNNSTVSKMSVEERTEAKSFVLQSIRYVVGKNVWEAAVATLTRLATEAAVWIALAALFFSETS
jgi:hypothetical protein